MNFLNIELISEFAPILYALMGALWGDSFVLVLGFLYSQELIPYFWPTFYTFVGLFVADLMFYFIGRSKLFDILKKNEKTKKFIGRIDSTIEFLTADNLLLALFYCKFVPYAKFIINAYLGKRKTPFVKFVFLNFFMAVFWTIVAFFVGYLSGKGFDWVWKVFENLMVASLVILLIMGIIHYLGKRTKKYMRKKYPGKK